MEHCAEPADAGAVVDSPPHPRYTQRMTTASDLRRDSDALAALTALKDRLPGDYLIVGPHASYAYHRWMFPIAKMIHLRIRADDLEKWRAVLSEPWTTLHRIPTHDDTRSALRLAVLETTLTEALWKRHQIIKGLSYISLEDLAAEMLAGAEGQISILEVAGMLIAQKDKLDWSYFLARVAENRTYPWLKAIIEIVNMEIGREFVPPAPALAPAMESAQLVVAPDVYFVTPTGRHRPPSRPLISRPIIGKVVLDLEYHWRERDRVLAA